jgi:polysaccharide export outer membrane protein
MRRTACFLCFAAAAAAWQAQTPAPRASYALGPDDQLIIRALEAEEISEKPVRIDLSGYIRLPLVGRVKAAGLTVEQLEAEIAGRLKEFIKEPQVAVSITEFRSQPVSVIGAVKEPGVHQLQGRKTLIEMLSLAGGLSEDAGNVAKITRRLEFGRIPLPGAADDPTGQYSVAQVELRSVMEARNPQENVLIQPFDVISVPRAELVYVIGQVKKAGGFVLRERETMSVLQALSLAEGLDRVSAPQAAKILRQTPDGGQRTEIAVNVKKILEGKAGDVALQPQDILFIPASAAKAASLRAAEAAIQITTGMIIWRR